MSLEKIQMDKENVEKRKSFPDFKSGDTINVHVKIREGNKERIQQFQGTVIQRRNIRTNGETFTIRKISDSIAVEKILPLFSPNIEKIMSDAPFITLGCSVKSSSELTNPVNLIHDFIFDKFPLQAFLA